jgi:hypothetical protein
MAFTSIKATSKGGKDFLPVPAGVHMAICTQVVDLGFQESFNKKYKPKRQVYIKFEIPGVQVKWEKDGVEKVGPATTGRTFGLSISEMSNLRPFLVSWRGKDFTAAEEEGFEITSILGKLCQLSIVHEPSKDGKKTYANISGAFALIDLQKADLKANPAKAKPSQPLLAYSPEAHDQAIWEQLPEWLQKKIESRVDETSAPDDGAGYNGTESQAGATAAEDFNDDIPF